MLKSMHAVNAQFITLENVKNKDMPHNEL